ncbi:MAG: bifunctional glycosyltransferase family 2/GtrA family protein [Lachnospiraceae bacterium]|nr:bifunctional glycosyltransferase family 2/GtrA family protein [Lachnospiraceae bacterium]
MNLTKNKVYGGGGTRLKVLAAIPSLEPTKKLLQLVGDLRSALQQDEDLLVEILIVDDGSGAEYSHLFEEAKSRYNCILLKHAVNLGKGRALKTAFNYYLNELTGFDGIVTIDSDGQHAVNDIIKCIKNLSPNGNSIILGCRGFSCFSHKQKEERPPVKSLFGNILTRNALHFLCGIYVSDTQTGLRVLPTDIVKAMITVPGERFEYEMNMLLECKNSNYGIKEVPIETIYANQNKGTHFNPLTDSIKIYRTLIKYSFSALSSFLIDILLFSLFISMTKNNFSEYISISTIMARTLSSIWNYFLNNRAVFASYQIKSTIWKYYLLVLAQVAASSIFTTIVYFASPLSEIYSKILVDTILFFASFVIQREWVFAKKNL